MAKISVMCVISLDPGAMDHIDDHHLIHSSRNHWRASSLRQCSGQCEPNLLYGESGAGLLDTNSSFFTLAKLILRRRFLLEGTCSAHLYFSVIWDDQYKNPNINKQRSSNWAIN